MATNSWIGIANAIGFKRKTIGGITPPIEVLDALLLEQTGAILLENNEYIKLEEISNVKSIKYSNNGNTRKENK